MRAAGRSHTGIAPVDGADLRVLENEIGGDLHRERLEVAGCVLLLTRERSTPSVEAIKPGPQRFGRCTVGFQADGRLLSDFGWLLPALYRSLPPHCRRKKRKMAIQTVEQPRASNYLRGAAYGLSAVCIWAAFIVVSRLGVQSGLTPWDVAAIRFAVAGVCLLPYLLKRGLALDRLGWIGVSAIAIGCGAPMVLLVNAGLLFAPAAHGGALFPGVMPLMVAVLAAIILKERFTSRKSASLILIMAGAITIIWATGGTLGTQQNIGHALFLCAGLAWAAYTVAMRYARLDGLHAAAISGVASLVFYVPVYLVITRGSVFHAPVADIALQAVIQGLLTAIVALLLYGRMVAILGATAGAAFVALTPATTALLAIPVLHEWPSRIDWIAIVLISIGVYVLSGGPLPFARTRQFHQG
jgi:drug/metabolite transporter (DMT)-like permease